MVLQAFIDDSQDTDSGIYVLAGYVASVEQWAAFSQEWEALLPSAVNNKGKFRFKMSEMARFGKMDAVPAFYNTIMRHVDMSVACIVNRHDIETAVDNLASSVNDPVWGEVEINIDRYKAYWRKPFIFAFRALMDSFHRERVKNPEMFPIDGRVDFYFDTDSNENLVRSVWDDYLARRPAEYRDSYGKKPEFYKDEEFVALQAADFRAWWVRKWMKELGPDRLSEGTYPFNAGEKKIRHVIMTLRKDQIQPIVAEAVGVAIQEAVQKGAPLVPASPSAVRFWPRDPL